MKHVSDEPPPLRALAPGRARVARAGRRARDAQGRRRSATQRRRVRGRPRPRAPRPRAGRRDGRCTGDRRARADRARARRSRPRASRRAPERDAAAERRATAAAARRRRASARAGPGCSCCCSCSRSARSPRSRSAACSGDDSPTTTTTQPTTTTQTTTVGHDAHARRPRGQDLPGGHGDARAAIGSALVIPKAQRVRDATHEADIVVASVPPAGRGAARGDTCCSRSRAGQKDDPEHRRHDAGATRTQAARLRLQVDASVRGERHRRPRARSRAPIRPSATTHAGRLDRRRLRLDGPGARCRCRTCRQDRGRRARDAQRRRPDRARAAREPLLGRRRPVGQVAKQNPDTGTPVQQGQGDRASTSPTARAPVDVPTVAACRSTTRSQRLQRRHQDPNAIRQTSTSP